MSDNVISTGLTAPDQKFIDTVRDLRYRWDNGRWRRKIGPFAEPVMDRAVELGVRLLAAGFPVVVTSRALYDRIAASDYWPEIQTWVVERTNGKFTGWFCIYWPRDEERYYNGARLIHGSRIYPGSALVPRERFDEVLDFAQSNGFTVSDGARVLAETARRERAGLLVVTPEIKRHAAPTKKEDCITDDIPDDLVDHDDAV